MEPPLLSLVLLRGALLALPFALWFAWRWWARRSGHEMGSTPYQTGTGYLITPVVGFVAEGFTLTANPEEVADIFETPFGFLMDPRNYEQQERELPTGEKRRFYAMTHEDRFIWGATAGMLRMLYNRLYGAAVA